MKRIYQFLVLTLVCSNYSHAQFFKKLQDKAQESMERALEKKQNEKIDRTTEVAVDTLFDTPKKITKSKKLKEKKAKVELNDTDEEVITQVGNAIYEPKYVFSVTATIEIEDASAGFNKNTMKQGYGKESLITEMEKNGESFIIDMKNESAIMLNIKSGMAQVMSLKWMEKMMGSQDFSNKEQLDVVPVVKKTGKTKVMNGYTCHEYDITYDKGRINAWYAPDVKFEYQDYLRGMAKLFSKKKEENPMQLLNTDYGYVMEMTFFNKQSKKQNSMKVISLNETVRMINMSLFKIQKL